MSDNRFNHDSIPTCNCHPRTVELYLLDDLDSDSLECFERHLTTCVDCRKLLSERAAEASWWSEAQQFLGEADLKLADIDPFHSAMGETDDLQAQRDALIRLLAPTDDPRMLGRIGGYEILGLVGQGGMGIVFKGFDIALNRYVAIKVLAPHLATSGAARERFAREARAAAAVVHENVVAIYGVAEHQRLPYLVMPYIRGSSLQKRLDDRGPLSLAEILRISVQCAAGLAAAHAQGLVHRDIKPANILLAEGVERIKITDFGLARAVDDASLTHTGVIAGTPQFMSPEQATGDPIDHRSDLFSLGSVIYTMCTGRAPFRAETSLAVLRRITDTSPTAIRELNPAIPEWLCTIVGKLHARQAADRYSSADEVQELLQQCLAHTQSSYVSLPLCLQPTTKTSPISRWQLWGSLAVCLLTIAAAYMLFAAANTHQNRDAMPMSDSSVIMTESTVNPAGASGNNRPVAEHKLDWEDNIDDQLEQLDRDLTDLLVEP